MPCACHGTFLFLSLRPTTDAHLSIPTRHVTPNPELNPIQTSTHRTRYCLEPHLDDNVARLVSSAAEVYGDLRATGATKGDIMNGIALLAEEPRQALQPIAKHPSTDPDYSSLKPAWFGMGGSHGH